MKENIPKWPNYTQNWGQNVVNSLQRNSCSLVITYDLPLMTDLLCFVTCNDTTTRIWKPLERWLYFLFSCKILVVVSILCWFFELYDNQENRPLTASISSVFIARELSLSFHPCLYPRWRLRFMFSCLWFLHFHALTPTVITLQTSLKWINFSQSGRWTISCVHIVCDYCSVTPDADPGLCAVLFIWEECRHISLQIAHVEHATLSFSLLKTHLEKQSWYFWQFITLWHPSKNIWHDIFSFLNKCFWVLESVLSSTTSLQVFGAVSMASTNTAALLKIYRCSLLDL